MRQARPGALSPELILRLQATAGNRAVQRLIERQRPTGRALVPAEPVLLETAQEETVLPKPSWWRRHLRWIAGPGTMMLPLIAGRLAVLHSIYSACYGTR